jgi:hypothetical protein
LYHPQKKTTHRFFVLTQKAHFVAPAPLQETQLIDQSTATFPNTSAFSSKTIPILLVQKAAMQHTTAL